jgi:hypothetical protein
MDRENWIKKIRFFTLALILSIALNIGLLANFFYQNIKDKNSTSDPLVAKDEAEKINELSNIEFINYCSAQSFRELVLMLSNKEILEVGYCKRDLALSSLVTFHDFNIKKALLEQPLQKRLMYFEKNQEKIEIVLFPELTDYQFESVIQYATTERWPITSKGLFNCLKNGSVPRDLSLEEAFFLTPEFLKIRTLFNRDDTFVRHDTLLHMICEGSWQDLENILNNLNFDFSKKIRQDFLLNYLNLESKMAAHLLLQLDYETVLNKFTNDTILKILEKIEIDTEFIENFCIELLKSPRSDEIWEKSAVKLYSSLGEKLPEPFDHRRTLARFDQSFEIKEKLTQIEPIIKHEQLETDLYIVKDGDNLWKIARKFKVELKELIKANNLTFDKIIYPGKEIVIPEKGSYSTGS